MIFGCKLHDTARARRPCLVVYSQSWANTVNKKKESKGRSKCCVSETHQLKEKG